MKNSLAVTLLVHDYVLVHNLGTLVARNIGTPTSRQFSRGPHPATTTRERDTVREDILPVHRAPPQALRPILAIRSKMTLHKLLNAVGTPEQVMLATIAQ